MRARGPRPSRRGLRLSQTGWPGVVTVAVPSSPGRHVRVDTDVDMRWADVSGIDEWHSFWGPIPSVAQLEVPHDGTASFSYRITPLPRVAGTIKGHPYEDELYRPIEQGLNETELADAYLARVEAAIRSLKDRNTLTRL